MNGEGHGNPLQYSCLENPMDKGASCSPWGCKESDMTEQLSTQNMNYAFCMYVVQLKMLKIFKLIFKKEIK